MKSVRHIFVVFWVIGVSGSGCEKFVEVREPEGVVIGNTAFFNEEAATATITGIYHQMIGTPGFANGSTNSVSILAALSADELNSFVDFGSEFLRNELVATNSVINELWLSAYNIVYLTNASIKGLNESSALDDSIKNQLIGEARFIRAFCYFYLTNLFGDVPYVNTTDYRINLLASRTSQEVIYDSIINDLLFAKANLPAVYPTAERTRVNKYAAAAMLARVYLYREHWNEAEAESTFVIDYTNDYEILEDLNSVFLANSREAIWQLPPVYSGSTAEGGVFVVTVPSPGGYVAVVPRRLIDSFESGDNRLRDWIGLFDDGSSVIYFPYKYKVQYSEPPATEFSMVLRLAEQYLIRAEARVHTGKMVEAISDIDVIRQRAGLPPIANVNPGIDTEQLITEILNQRKFELYTEWGHRWLDLKRTNRANEVLAPIKDDWQETDLLYPLPQSEINKAPNLRPQNPGY